MLGCYDFCGYYEATFQWLEERGGEELLHKYWLEAISKDSQRHARDLILGRGADGMMEYWGHTLNEESPDQGFSMSREGDVVRIDMHDCPSKGFLLRNGLEQYRDYCDHCIGWIGPLMKDAGYVIHHEHNHCGQCWWEFHKAENPSSPSDIGKLAKKDVRLTEDWKEHCKKLDAFFNAQSVLEKKTEP